MMLSPRAATRLALFLAIVLTLDVGWAATHHRPQPSATLEPCALVLTEKDGPVCR